MKTINVSEETYEAIKHQLQTKPENSFDITKVKELSDLIGHKFYIRTVTYHMTGRIINIIGTFLVMEDSAWVAESGRFMQAIKDGVLNEVEPSGPAFINIDSITDMFPWVHDLPNKQI